MAEVPQRRASRAQSAWRAQWASLCGAAAAFAATLALGACTSHAKVHEGEMSGLLAVLPGRYDNTAQAEEEARNGMHAAHDAVALTITHVFTPRLGHHVYYAQETAADDPRRVLSQKMYSFEVDEKRGIVETLYEFVEPLRWRDGQNNKDMFSSLMTDDVQIEGCQLLWKKQGSGYVATHDPKVCPESKGSPSTEAELDAGVLTIGEYKFRKTH